MSNQLVQEKKEGRPRKYETSEELQKKIDEYFESGVRLRTVIVGPPNHRSVELIKVPTISGLALYLGFCDRHSFYDLEKMPEFSHTIKAARSRMEQEYEEALQCGLGAGAIFALKNFGWKDKTEVEHSGSVSLVDKINAGRNRVIDAIHSNN